MNNKILKERWEKVDELLSTFLTKNQKISRRMQDNIQSILDGVKFSYDQLNDYASNTEVIRLRGRIDDLREQYGLTGYIGFELDGYSKKKKLKNREILLAYLMIEYYKENLERNEIEETLFDEVSVFTYESVSVETAKALHKKRKKKEFPKVWWLGILLNLGYNGFSWLHYKQGTLGYNANKLYEAIIIMLQQNKPLSVNAYEIKKLLDKQQRSYLSRPKVYKTEQGYKATFSGSLDNQISFLVNQTALQAMKDQGCTQVQFVAVEDEKTTKMCDSLDGQIFDIYKKNTYTRYSAEDGKKVEYTTVGLETGANLPPINNHFHYCRSTIYPYK